MDSYRKTWNDAKARWIEEKGHKRSIDSDVSRFRWLDMHLSGVPLADIDRAVVKSLIEKKIATGVQDSTVNRMLALLRAVLNFAVSEWEWMASAPKIRLLREPTRRIRYLTWPQAVRLLQELPEHLAAMAAFALATGLRKTNVLCLKWDQIDLDRQIAWLHGDEMKSGRALTIPLNVDAARILLTRVGLHQTHVFSYKGQPVKQVSTAAWYKALKRAGIHNFRWHDLRHTWASWHVQNGTPLFVLQELGGWESAEMVRRYAHFSVSSLAPYTSNLPSLSGPDKSGIDRKTTPL